MLHKYFVLDGKEILLSDTKLPNKEEIEKYLEKRFERLNQEFPSGNIVLKYYPDGHTEIVAPPEIVVRLNELDNTPGQNR